MTFEEVSTSERLIAEQAVLNLRSLNTTCDLAADGTVLAIAETPADWQNRELTKKNLAGSGRCADGSG